MNIAPTLFSAPVPDDLAGTRFDRALVLLHGVLLHGDLLHGDLLHSGVLHSDPLQGAPLSRSRLKALIENGHARINGATITEPSHKVKAGEMLELTLPDATPARQAAQAIALDVVYEDQHLIVIDKPAGLVVHPAPGNADGTLVNALLAHCAGSLSGIGGVERPGIVHRLDKDTSGLMVAAKTDAAHRYLAAQFASHTVERLYAAIVRGVPRPAEGDIEGAIGRDPGNRKRMAIVRNGGKPARTHYRTLELFSDRAAMVECRLATGRTHQIRVHLTAIGCPLAGDGIYGRKSAPRTTALDAEIASFGRQALDAFVLGFAHPVDGRPLRFARPVAPDLAAFADRLRRAAASLGMRGSKG